MLARRQARGAGLRPESANVLVQPPRLASGPRYPILPPIRGRAMTGAAAIAEALGSAQRSGKWWRCICPVHNSHSASLALCDGPRGLILHCHAGCPRDDVLAQLRRLDLVDADTGDSTIRSDPAELERQREAEARDRQRRIAEALDFWQHETADPHGTAIERYWLARGLAPLIPPTIRTSRSWLRHPEGGSRPAMIALVQHAELGPVAIHRTWLQLDGLKKASFHEPRRSLGPIKGGAVRLARAGELLLVGEGIETTAAAMTATGLPGWAALSAGGIEALILPPLPIASTVIILADNDPNGRSERAARIAAQRWLREGRRVRVAMPPETGTDFNDLLLNQTPASIGVTRNVA
jgi:putative DNA primase/helicase